MLVIEPNIRIPLDEFVFTFVRSAGPGGQNVNKVNTKAVLRWAIAASPSLTEAVRSRFTAKYGKRLTGAGELVLTSQRFRDQSRNRADCLEKLGQMLASVATAPKKRKRTRPTLASRERRLVAKRHRSEHKQLRRERPDD
ncbi:MAG TPA: alternative ribosome rescue aminoacyl-tRNA hydrolase ArfB [Pirellulales bacterium]|jgi:ribosome-associated protein|nr:alternative ribosome rescue aminoacyl-tRNA hydrolase ArfB [Pirellulales bacterium]